MYTQIIQRVELNPETDDNLIEKYYNDERWNRIYNNPDRVVFESVLSKSKYKSDLIEI